jgi:hypothetical protein
MTSHRARIRCSRQERVCTNRKVAVDDAVLESLPALRDILPSGPIRTDGRSFQALPLASKTTVAVYLSKVSMAAVNNYFHCIATKDLLNYVNLTAIRLWLSGQDEDFR